MMTPSGLKQASLNALIVEFVASSVRQQAAMDDVEFENEDDYEVVNREIRWGWTVRDEILARGPDAIVALLALFKYENIQVMLNAAMAVKYTEPQKARDMIEAIAYAFHPPQSGDAMSFLHYFDKEMNSEEE